MKKRRILSAALATIMALGLSVPSYALEEEDTSPTPIIEEGGDVSSGGRSIDDITIPIIGDDENAIEEDEVDEITLQKSPWEPETPKHNDFQVNSLNFYINLAGDVLDTKEGSGHYYASRFTSALTSTYSVDGSGLEAAVMKHPDYVYISNYYDGIVGANESDYARIDGEIRNILSSYIDVPSDSDILTNVKTQIQNGTKINDINGAMISDSLVSTDYFNVYWYVLKEGNSEWHVDGILEKKDIPTVNTFLVEYSWKTIGGPGLPSSYEVPATVEYAEGDVVDIDTTYTEGMEIHVDGGKYVFSGWNIEESFEIHSDNSIYGEWRFIPNEPVIDPTPVSFMIPVQKLLDGAAPTREFTFTLNTEDDTLDIVTTDSENFTFNPINYTEAGTHQYTVKEFVKDGSDDNIIYDNSVYDVTINVILDEENNKLEALAEYSLNGEIVNKIIFNNTTKESPPPIPPMTEDPDPIEITLQGVKYLDTQVAGGFTFVVSDDSGILANVHSNDNGVFKFVDSISEPGRYNYIIREQIPENTGNIIYDESFYTAEITVALNKETNEYYIANQSLQHVNDMGEGTDSQMIIFNNTTKENPPIDPPTPPVKDPTVASIILSGEKYLDKNTPSTQFDFVLKDSTGKEIETVKNTGKDFTFGALFFNKEGTYQYTINEVTGNNNKIKYDNTVYTVVITVTLDYVKNAYAADVVITSNTNTSNLNAIVFNNETISDSDSGPDSKPHSKPDPKPEPTPTPTPDPIPTPEPTPDPVIIPEPVEEPKDEPKIDDVPKTGEPISLSLAFTTLIGTLGIMGFINCKKKEEDQQIKKKMGRITLPHLF